MSLSPEYVAKIDSRKRVSIGKLASQLNWTLSTKIVERIEKRGDKSIIVLEEGFVVLKEDSVVLEEGS